MGGLSLFSVASFIINIISGHCSFTFSAYERRMGGYRVVLGSGYHAETAKAVALRGVWECVEN